MEDGAHGDLMGHVVRRAEEVFESGTDNATTPHLKMEE